MILDDIVAAKRQELARTKRAIPLEEIKKAAAAAAPALDFASSIKGHRIKLIAEIKKASPSAGVIREDFQPAAIAKIYADNGAAAISVLTESAFFQGNLKDLQDVRAAVGDRIPLLRKDFIFEPYQVYEARANGADSLLLITSILTVLQLKSLLNLSRKLGMEPVVEIHNRPELDAAVKSGAKIIGINNRNLTTFRTDLVTTTILRPHVPGDKIVISESGIRDSYDVAALRHNGADAVLIGEALMSASDIAAKMKEFLR